MSPHLPFTWAFPLWLSDNDFEETGVESYTTAELLRKLGVPTQNR